MPRTDRKPTANQRERTKQVSATKDIIKLSNETKLEIKEMQRLFAAKIQTEKPQGLNNNTDSNRTAQFFIILKQFILILLLLIFVYFWFNPIEKTKPNLEIPSLKVNHYVPSLSNSLLDFWDFLISTALESLPSSLIDLSELVFSIVFEIFKLILCPFFLAGGIMIEPVFWLIAYFAAIITALYYLSIFPALWNLLKLVSNWFVGTLKVTMLWIKGTFSWFVGTFKIYIASITSGLAWFFLTSWDLFTRWLENFIQSLAFLWNGFTKFFFESVWVKIKVFIIWLINFFGGGDFRPRHFPLTEPRANDDENESEEEEKDEDQNLMEGIPDPTMLAVAVPIPQEIDENQQINQQPELQAEIILTQSPYLRATYPLYRTRSSPLEAILDLVPELLIDPVGLLVNLTVDAVTGNVVVEMLPPLEQEGPGVGGNVEVREQNLPLFKTHRTKYCWALVLRGK